MAERKAVNKYYPPEWRPEMGSLNTFHGSHPLRERARKLHQGIMIMRFELPFNIWCAGCGNHIGVGVRYNAEKTQVGKYYSTPIFQFRMKCHLCDNHFEIRNDPKNCDYTVVRGASRKNEKWEHKEGETVSIAGREEATKLASDAMYRLEHGVGDKRKAEDATPRIEQIKKLQESKLDDFALNQLLRSRLREEKKQKAEEAAEQQRLQDKAGLNITIVKESQADIAAAKRIKFDRGSSKEKGKLQVRSAGIFDKKQSSSKSWNVLSRLDPSVLRKKYRQMQASIYDMMPFFPLMWNCWKSLGSL
ncbi:probable splicing factor YJU2B isoform X3 [Dysidea avara]|uniref:probable splicing factor YJU2B isoform X3 n=1 Tax=Dysidea avara TaxID=196820 RepID=UPI00331C2185